MPITVPDMRNPGSTVTITDGEIARIIRMADVLGSGISGRLGVRVRPGTNWAADVDKKELIYDLGAAAIMDDEQRVGVIAHEAGHLRFTRNYDQSKLTQEAQDHPEQFQMLCNVFEDKRMENLMSDEFPGLAGNFDRLADTLDLPEMRKLLQEASPDKQFMHNLYRVIYGRDNIATTQEVYDAVEKHRGDCEALVSAKTTQEVADLLLERDGIFETYKQFMYEEPPEEGGESGDGQGDGDGEEGGSGAPADGDGDGQSQSGDGDGDGDGDGNGGKDGKDGDGEDDGDGQQGSTDRGGGRSGTLTGQTTTTKSAPKLKKPQGQSPDGGPTLDDLNALTQHQRQLIDDLLEASKTSGDDEVVDLADQIEERLDDVAQTAQSAGLEISTRRANQQMIADDRKNTSENPEGYAKIQRQVGRQASVLSRSLESVLRENAFDRWSSAGYDSGPRVHTRKLTEAATGNRAVFRRKERPKNRRYAVSIAVDISGSMDGSPIRKAMESTVLVSEALEKAGIESAVYGFGAETICLKPFDKSLAERRGKIGAAPALMHGYGGSTCMGWAVKRMAEELVSSYDDSWEQLLIVITDGHPNSCSDPQHYEHADPRPFVKELTDRGVEAIGIGINSSSVTTIFPSSAVITDVSQLPRELTKAIRTRVRKG